MQAISALLQLEVKAGLLSHRLIEVCVRVCLREDHVRRKRKLLQAVGSTEASGATAAQEILFTYG